MKSILFKSSAVVILAVVGYLSHGVLFSNQSDTSTNNQENKTEKSIDNEDPANDKQDLNGKAASDTPKNNSNKSIASSEASPESTDRTPKVEATTQFVSTEEPKALDTSLIGNDPIPHFIGKYCIDCHGEKKQKGDRRFDGLTSKLVTSDDAEHFQEILDALNLGEMPPEDEPMPSDAEMKQMVDWLTHKLEVARNAENENSGQAVLRRLNKTEYNNTIRDLFSLKMNDFNPSKHFPADDTLEGFDNVGEALVTSDYLLQNYLEAARKVAQKVVRPGPKPKKIHYKAEGQKIRGTTRGFIPEVARMLIKERQPLSLPQMHKRGVPADGEYVIRITAKAHQRKSRYKDRDLRYNSNEPMKLALKINSRASALSNRTIGHYDLPDDKPLVIEKRLWLDEGFRFSLHWANGPNGSFKRIIRKVLPKYTKDAIMPDRGPAEMYVGSGPELHVYSVEIEGPFYDEWPPKGFASYFPKPPAKPTASYLDDSLKRLAQKAFRRPVTDTELAPYLKLARAHLAKKKDFWEAARYGIRALLVSPRFIYHPEEQSSGKQQLGPYELANRLSYFVWSSMPDEELFRCAENGTILDPKVLHAQLERMLEDPKGKAFSKSFASQWLHLRKLGEMPPDPATNREFYANNLKSAMETETQMFFDNILKNNGPLSDFIDSDYTFLNEALANHYGIDGVSGKNFRRVTLRPEHRRGGLLGQGSILTATSNGVETQPVIRGVWILENLLGSPPSAPPPDVDPIEPDTRGVKTMRELMEKHRTNKTCFECHKKIDPLGLAMENFNHVGAWRDRYNKRSAIDASGKMPDGTQFVGSPGIKDYLKARPKQFIHCLTEKLFVYGLSRRVSFTDRDDIDAIVENMKKPNKGLRDLIHMVVSSEPFLTK